MPVVPLKEIVDRAFAERYGVAAINVVNDLTMEAVLSGQVLDRLHRGLREAGQEPLTRRERQVRGLMELGLPDKVIAERLVLSVKTVEKHAGAVLRKTGARNRTELAAQANRVRGVR